MRYALPMVAVLGCAPALLRAELADVPLTLSQIPDTVYAPPSPPSENEGLNEGGVNMNLFVNYMSDYVYRGVDRSEVGGTEDSPNLQVDTKVMFDLGKLPHPFVGVFVNVYDADPISRFQEIRPYFGFDLDVHPFMLTAGHISYIYPDRDDLTTAEVYGKILLDDSYIFSTETPIFSPYILAAYDYELNNGWYFEFGVSHEIVIPDTGLTITGVADVAYNRGMTQQFVFTSPEEEGWSHYDLGLIAAYSLNTLLNIPRRYGDWTFEGYLFYTDRLDDDTDATTQMWGGVGLGFRY